MQLLALPLYGGLPYSEQLRVFHRTPHNTRKVRSQTVDNCVICPLLRVNVEYRPLTS